MSINYIQRNKERERFQNWKRRAKIAVKPYISKFFAEGVNDTDKERRIGMILKDLNTPTFDIQDDYGKRYPEESIMAIRILLQIEVEEFIQYMINKFGRIK